MDIKEGNASKGFQATPTLVFVRRRPLNDHPSAEHLLDLNIFMLIRLTTSSCGDVQPPHYPGSTWGCVPHHVIN